MPDQSNIVRPAAGAANIVAFPGSAGPPASSLRLAISEPASDGLPSAFSLAADGNQRSSSRYAQKLVTLDQAAA